MQYPAISCRFSREVKMRIFEKFIRRFTGEQLAAAFLVVAFVSFLLDIGIRLFK